ncbi:PMS1 protein homolog 1 [Pelobates fuscus]|uniref:PMS1 protein homolog 1 n=1 Tax=Pelobates fuscus TaxID=191477 RepID=UPI002FE43F58
MHHLPSTTIRLLSSSQVITSVVSVVKELVENALDANATNVEIKLENFGFDKIEVRDNGDGIKASDTPVMGIKHYTSKINTHEDLENLETYGFRGEALGSICSVAEVHITTKTAVDDLSTQYVLDASGHILSQKPSHLGQGTTVSVLKLFKNLPVRKQYYSTTKKCKEELRRIQDLMMAYGIIKPDLRIVFVHNKAVIWQKSKVSDHKMSFMSVLGTAIMSSMVPFQHQCENPEMYISGYLPKPEADRTLTSLSTSERSFLFINRRPVQYKEITKMIRLFYNQSQNKDSSRSYPVFFMNIVLPASCLDVNVTPDKTQVMIQNKESVMLAVEDILKSVYPYSENDKAHVQSEEAINEHTDKNTGKNKSSGNQSPLQDNLCSSINSYQVDKESDGHDVNMDCDVGKVDCTGYQKRDAFQDGTANSSLHDECNYAVNFAIGNNVLMNTQPNSELDSPNAGPIEGKEISKNPDVNDDLDNLENWSKGNALKNSRGENLEPVKILSSRVEIDVGENKSELNVLKSPENTVKKLSNVISEKSGFITAYDLINNKVIKKPKSAIELFIQEHRSRLLDENPEASIEDISSQAEELWEQLTKDEKSKYSDKAAKDLQRYKAQSEKVTGQNIQKPKDIDKKQRLSSEHSPAQKVKLRTPLSNQQILDKMFQSQVEKKTSTTIKTVPITFALSTLKRQQCLLSEKKTTDANEFSLISKLNYPGAWVVASEQKVTLLNPYRMEETLLFKRLVENHIISSENLDSPIILTDRLLGGAQYLNVLLNMEKESPKLNGDMYISDVRLTSNGFRIKIIPGKSAVDSRIQIEGLPTCLPFYGISDLKEVLNSVMNTNGKELCDCRPLKVLNYLEGEAVRLSRQLPFHLTKDDVLDTLCRMKTQLGSEHNECMHGRPFFHHLTDIPQTG